MDDNTEVTKPWELAATRTEDGGVMLSLSWEGASVILSLTDEDRQEMAQVFGDPAGAGYYRTARKDRP